MFKILQDKRNILWKRYSKSHRVLESCERQAKLAVRTLFVSQYL